MLGHMVGQFEIVDFENEKVTWSFGILGHFHICCFKSFDNFEICILSPFETYQVIWFFRSLGHFKVVDFGERKNKVNGYLVFWVIW